MTVAQNDHVGTGYQTSPVVGYESVPANSAFGPEALRAFKEWSDSQNAKTKEERIREAALRYCEVKGLDPNAWAVSGDMVAIGYHTPKILDNVIREMERLQDTILMQKCLESST